MISLGTEKVTGEGAFHDSRKHLIFAPPKEVGLRSTRELPPDLSLTSSRTL